jgi:hypothetical protein
MNTKAVLFVMLGAYLPLVPGSAAELERPKFCAVVGTKSVNDDETLLGEFDRFTAKQKFERSSADPGAHAYQKRNGDLELDVIVGVGDLGSIIAFYDSTKPQRGLAVPGPKRTLD